MSPKKGASLPGPSFAEEITPDVLSRINWTMVLAIPWHWGSGNLVNVGQAFREKQKVDPFREWADCTIVTRA
jgi:hypothetical protein